MELPQRLPKKTEHRRILGEFYDINKDKQWFHRAEFIEMHPTHLKPTLVVVCDYHPALELKELLQFTANHNIALEIVNRSNIGG